MGHRVLLFEKATLAPAKFFATPLIYEFIMAKEQETLQRVQEPDVINKRVVLEATGSHGILE